MIKDIIIHELLILNMVLSGRMPEFSFGDILPSIASLILIGWGVHDLWNYRQHKEKAAFRDGMLLLCLGFTDGAAYAYQRLVEETLQKQVNATIKRNSDLAIQVTTYGSQISDLKSQVIQSKNDTIEKQKELLSISRDNLASVTGGDSHPFVNPDYLSTPLEAVKMPLMVTISGKYALFDVRMEILEGPPPYQVGGNYGRQELQLGNLVPKVSSGIGYSMPVSSRGVSSCTINFIARNGFTTEWLEVRLNQKIKHWQYRAKVSKFGDYRAKWGGWIPPECTPGQSPKTCGGFFPQ